MLIETEKRMKEAIGTINQFAFEIIRLKEEKMKRIKEAIGTDLTSVLRADLTSD